MYRHRLNECANTTFAFDNNIVDCKVCGESVKDLRTESERREETAFDSDDNVPLQADAA